MHESRKSTMAIEVRVPEVSENVSQGKVISVLVAVGDLVEVDQSLIELETDKAVVAIPSPVGGKVASIQAAEGATLKIGDVILSVENAGAAASPKQQPQRRAAKVGSRAAVESEPPAAARAEPSAEALAESPAAARAEPSTAAQLEPPAAAKSEPPAAARPVPPASGDDEIIPAGPAVRRLARELGVDLRSLRGSGPGGRISPEDVKERVRARQNAASSPESAAPAPQLPDFTRWGSVRREALSRVREITAETMARAWRTIPQVTHYDRADITELEAFRREVSAEPGAQALSLTVILLKAAAAALKAHPRVASSLDVRRGELIYKEYTHIAVAVDTPHGLLVPVIRDVDRKGLRELSGELADLASRARERRVNPAELEGGVFTISNLGGIGGVNFSPIVYPPQVAILGVSRASREPVWKDDGFTPRLLLPLALSYDHRVIDGAEAARFLAWLVRALEQPLMLSM